MGSNFDRRLWYTVKPVYNDHPRDPKYWPLLTGGRCSEVIYVIKGLIGTTKQWPL